MRNEPARYKTIRGLARGLDVLHALNQRPMGSWGIVELASHVGLHHTTLKRILETLHSLGYVAIDPLTSRYQLTASVHQLCAGFRDDDNLVLAAQETLPELAKRLVWPLFLSTPDGDAMLVRTETHHFSPLAFHRTTLGYRFSLLDTATGRAYLAACTPIQRHELLRVAYSVVPNELRSIEDMERHVFSHFVEGFGCNDDGWGPFRDFSAVSVPVFLHKKVAGCLTVGFPTRVIHSALAIREFGETLRAGAEVIANKAAHRISGSTLAFDLPVRPMPTARIAPSGD